MWGLLLIALGIPFVSACTNTSECTPPRGVCNNTVCVCEAQYSGLDCSIAKQDVCHPKDPKSCSGHGNCSMDTSTGYYVCQCNKCYLHDDCSYEQKNKLTAFLLSLFIGTLGADRFYLEDIGIGVLKFLLGLSIWIAIYVICCGACCCIAGEDGMSSSDMRAQVTGGGCIGFGICLMCLIFIGQTIWWLVDWIYILTNALPDHNGMPVCNDNPHF